MEIFDILTYDYDKQSGILDIPDTYTPVTAVTTPTREAGVYEYGISITWVYDRTNTSAFLRFSTDGTTWNEFIAEPKDKTDSNTTYYAFPKVITTSGPLTLQVEMKKETGAGALDCNFADVYIKRVG